MRVLFIVFFWLNVGLALAINPIDVVFHNGVPETTHIGFSYFSSYTFTNNLPFPKRISTTAVSGAGFQYDALCNQVILAAKNKPGSTCTTYIAFQPSILGASRMELTLKYDNNVVPLRPALSTVVEPLCGTQVYPSNTGVPVPSPIIDSSQVWSFLSAPILHPMKVSVSPYNASLLGAGQIFSGPYASSGQSTYGQSGALIADNDGNPIWFRPLSSTSLMNTDVKVQTLFGLPVITFWQGTLATAPTYTNLPPGGAESGGCFYILDNSYQLIKTVSAFNGFTPDVHEFLITPSNTVLFFATKVIPMNLTSYGGPADGAIHDFSIQEVDLTTNELIFFWDAKDHIPLESTHLPASTASETSNVWDPYHLNSLGLISDGSDDILFSSRNTWTIYRLNKTSGHFVWRLSGDGSGDFTIPQSTAQFSWQHDARLLPGNIISMFDDGCCENYSTVPPGTIPSHGLELSLDLVNHVASFYTSYYHNPNLFSSSQGNSQILANGNRFLGLGSNGYYTEFLAPGNTQSTSSINLIYDAQMPGSNISYRSYRFNWVGRPYYPPSIAVTTANNQTTVFASWNGATEVRSWQIYAGLSPNQLQLIDSKTKDGFETAINISTLWSFFQVKALDAQGQVIGASKICTNNCTG